MKEPFDPIAFANRRAFGRRDTFKPCVIQWQDHETIECNMTNQSENGALLSFRVAPTTPENFNLIIREEDLLMTCRVAFRSDNTIGVEFVSLPRRASRTMRRSNQHRDALRALARNYWAIGSGGA